jgi:hypothetical protein
MQQQEWMMMMMNEVKAEEISGQKKITIDQGEISQEAERQINNRELQSMRKPRVNNNNQNTNKKMMKMQKVMVISEHT